jgi:hypothetical protein
MKIAIQLLLILFVNCSISAQSYQGLYDIHSYPNPQILGLSGIEIDFIKTSSGNILLLKRQNSSTIKVLRINTNGVQDSTYSIAFGQYFNQRFTKFGNAYCIGSKSGLLKFTEDGALEVFNTANSALPSNVLNSTLTVNGNLWIGTLDAGIAKFDGNSITNFSLSSGNLAADSVYAIAGAVGSIIYVSTANGLYSFDTNTTSSNLICSVTQSTLSANANSVIQTLEATVFISGNKLLQIDNQGVITEILITRVRSECPNSLGSPATFSRSYNFRNEYFLCTYNNDSGDLIQGVKLNGDCFSLPLEDLFPNIIINSQLLGNLISLSSIDTISYLAEQPNPLILVEIFPEVMEIQSQRDYGRGSMLERSDINAFNSNHQVLGKWNLGQYTYDAGTTVPACSTREMVFSSSFWIGAKNENGQVRFSGDLSYDQITDWQAGPLEEGSAQTTTSLISNFSRAWKLDRFMISEFIYAYSTGQVSSGVYSIPEDILSYPGNPIIGCGQYFAPYADSNQDGFYNPFDGDYPEISGDQQILSVMNDQGQHLNSLESGLGVEVWHYQSSSKCDDATINIDNPNNAVNNSIHHRFKIINKSTINYDSVFVGVSTITQSYSPGGYMGTIVDKNTQFHVSSAAIESYYMDGSPTYGVTVLDGPLAYLNDGFDNDNDGEIDEENEHCGLTNSMEYRSIMHGDINGPGRRYPLMKSQWLGGIQLTSGGSGFNTGSPTNHIYTGEPYSSNGWSEWSENNSAGNRTGIASAGPFILDGLQSVDFSVLELFYYKPGETNGVSSSWLKFNEYLDVSRTNYTNNVDASCWEVILSTDDKQAFDNKLEVYPNPSSDYVFLKWNDTPNKNSNLKIYCIDGRFIQSFSVSDSQSVDISNLDAGIYIIVAENNGITCTSKIVKTH